MKQNDRSLALGVLKHVFMDKMHLTLAMETFPLSSFAKALCFGVCRYYFSLEILALKLLDKRPKDVEVWLVILMGLYALQYLSTPPHASVKETVDLLDSNKKWAKGFVNAVLRRYCREKETIQLPASLSNHPSWFVERIKKDWPQDWKSILSANDKHPPFTLRVNQQKVSREAYLLQLREADMKARPLEKTPQGLVLELATDVKSLPGFTEGLVSVQEEAAQYAVSLLTLKPGLNVLDACSAPGGKLCHILETEPQLKVCLGLDLDKKRLARVSQNLQRLKLKATLQAGDATQPETWWNGTLYDRILLDAPCSALGVIRRHPDIKYLRTESEVDKVAETQAYLLASMWTLLKRGGLLVYATCSVMNQENAAQIAAFSTQHPDCEVDKQDKPWGINTGFGWQILPGSSNCDGFFYSVLRKI